jgi:hypothetical protein
MFKKRFVLLGAFALVACAIMLPPVRAAAVSALSIFRVADTKTITISVNDLREMLDYAQENDRAAQQGGEACDMLSQLMEKAESDVRTLSGVRDFSAFPFSLPEALKEETPALYAVDSQARSVTLDTEKMNAGLLDLGAAELLDSGLNGTVITLNTPPAVMAEYAEVVLAATQTVYIDAPDAVMNSLRSSFLSIPALPDDLRAQLAAISPDTRDVYLPVIEGLGRETDIKGTTGYVYSTGDLAQVLGMLPGFADDAHLKELQTENASVLIWLKDGVLYFLAGAMPDSALSQIARSVR